MKIDALVRLLTDKLESGDTNARKSYIRSDRAAAQAALKPLDAERVAMQQLHRAERLWLDKGLSERWQREASARAARLRSGLAGKAIDLLTGRLFAIRRENEREVFSNYQRDQAQLTRLIAAQLEERRELQHRIETLRADQRRTRMALARKIMRLFPEITGHERSARGAPPRPPEGCVSETASYSL